MNLIFDTNVLIAAFSTNVICHSLFEYALENCKIIISNHILDELDELLTDKFKLPQCQTDQIKLFLIESLPIVEYKISNRQVSRDKNDDPVLGIIDKNKIDYLVSGNKDLLILKNHKDVPIISHIELWDIFKQGK